MKRSRFALILVFFTGLALCAQEKPDALKLFRNGRALEAAGRSEDAKATYSQALEVCKQDLAENSKNMDAYTIYGWALVRLGKNQEAITISHEALKIASDSRIIETLAEAYFFTGNNKEALKYMEKYIDAAPRGDRISTAYFFTGEIYRMAKQMNRAEIAYSMAVYLEPALSLWWYRLGTVREILGEKTKAQEAYQKAVKLRPDYKEANDGLSRVRT